MMMLVLAYAVLALAVAAIAVFVLASRRPDTFSVARTRRIAAPPETIFPLINDLRTMNTWNPFALRDPHAVAGYEGPASGVGARHTFAGRKSGTGSITITNVQPPSEVVMRLLMTKPMKADNTVTFTIKPAGTGSDVTWAMTGRQPLAGKILTLAIDCDAMIGREFDKALASLQLVAEKA